MSTLPRVSVGLPVWNGAQFLPETIDALLAQDYPDFELIISDNGSTDDTEAICRDYLKSDDRIRYHRFHINQGAARNYNKVFELACGQYFKWAPHDDLCLPSLLRRCVETFEDAPASVVLVYARNEIIDIDGRVRGVDPTNMELRQASPHRRLGYLLRNINMGTPICGLLRSDILHETRLIDSFVGADYVLLAELAMRGQIWEIPELLLRRRIHPGTSRRANPTKEQTLVWYDPHNRRKIDKLSVHKRLVLEYLRSVFRCRLSLCEKLMCTLTVPTTFYWTRFRDLGGLCKQQLRRFLSQTTAPDMECGIFRSETAKSNALSRGEPDRGEGTLL